MRTYFSRCSFVVAVACLLSQGAAHAQDVVTTPPALPAADTGTLPVEPTLPVAEPTPLPADPVPPEATPPWTWQHQTQNQNGTVTNPHERTRSQDGNAYSFQHSVTQPNGSHTQLREYSQTDEGYQFMQQQRFYTPDGTLLREHATTVTGTDPLAPETAKPDKGFLSWLNPFKKRDSRQTAGSSTTAKRAGFTIGSFGRSRQLDTVSPGQARKASGLSNSSQIRSMKAKQTGAASHSASLPGNSGKTH